MLHFLKRSWTQAHGPVWCTQAQFGPSSYWLKIYCFSHIQTAGSKYFGCRCKKWVEKQQQQQKHLTMQKTIYFHSAINKTLWSNSSLSLSSSRAGSWMDLLWPSRPDTVLLKSPPLSMKAQASNAGEREPSGVTRYLFRKQKKQKTQFPWSVLSKPKQLLTAATNKMLQEWSPHSGEIN